MINLNVCCDNTTFHTNFHHFLNVGRKEDLDVGGVGGKALSPIKKGRQVQKNIVNVLK
jgi:hypothetical protein